MKAQRYFWTITVMVVAFALPAKAQNYEAQQPNAIFQSTSTMQPSGSTYSSAVYEVGSSSPSYAPAKGPRKAPPTIEPGTESNDYDPANPQFSPLGDVLIPLILFALAYVGYIALRKKKRVHTI